MNTISGEINLYEIAQVSLVQDSRLDSPFVLNFTGKDGRKVLELNIYPIKEQRIVLLLGSE